MSYKSNYNSALELANDVNELITRIADIKFDSMTADEAVRYLRAGRAYLSMLASECDTVDYVKSLGF